MAKAGIHPDYHNVTIVMTDGSRFSTRSTYGKEGDVITLDVDPKTHPAWVGGVNLRQTGRMEKFNNRFGGLNFEANTAVNDAEAKKKADSAA